MANLEGLNVQISANVNDFNSRMAGVQGRLAGLGSAFGGFATIATGALAGAGVALVGLGGMIGKVGVEYNAMQEQSAVAWETLLGNATKAQDMLKRISDFAKATPFETADVDMMAKYMHNAGLEGNALFKELMKASDVASAFAIPASEAKEMVRQMSQVRQAGLAYTEDLNILQDRGVPIYKAIAKEIGGTVGDVKMLASKGKLSSDIYIKAFDNIAKGVKGASDAQSKTFNGMLSTLSDVLKMTAGELSKPLFDVLKAGLEKVIPVLTKFLDILKNGGSFGDVLTAMGISPQVVSVITTVVSGIANGISGLFKWYTGAVKALFSGDGNLGTSFMKIFNAIKSIAMPILQDVVTFIKAKLDQIKQFWDENGAMIIQAVQNVWSVIAGIIQFIAPVILFVVKMLWDTVKGIIDGALKIIMGLIKIFAGLFTGNWSKMWEGIKQVIVGAIQLIWNWMNLMFIGRVLGAFKSFIKLGLGFFKGFGTSLGGFFKGLWTGIVNGVKGWVNAVKALFNTFKAMGLNIFQAFKGTLSIIWQGIKTVVVKVASGMYTGVKSYFMNIWNTAKSIFNGVKSAITSPIESAKKTVLGIIDLIKGAFAKMKITIPKPKLPKFSVAMKKGVMGIPYPDFNVSWNKDGGIWNGASIIGVGEAGPEAVVPLQGHRMKPFADAVASQIDGVGGGKGGNYEFSIPVIVDGREIARATAKYNQAELDRMSNRNNRLGGNL